MQPLLEPNLPGYGIFSLDGLILVLICILLLNLVHPLGLVANRAGDALGGLIRIFQKNRPSEMHGLDTLVYRLSRERWRRGRLVGHNRPA